MLTVLLRCFSRDPLDPKVVKRKRLNAVRERLRRRKNKVGGVIAGKNEPALPEGSMMMSGENYQIDLQAARQRELVRKHILAAPPSPPPSAPCDPPQPVWSMWWHRIEAKLTVDVLAGESESEGESEGEGKSESAGDSEGEYVGDGALAGAGNSINGEVCGFAREFEGLCFHVVNLGTSYLTTAAAACSVDDCTGCRRRQVSYCTKPTAQSSCSRRRYYGTHSSRVMLTGLQSSVPLLPLALPPQYA